MKQETFNNQLFQFIQQSPTPFHAAHNMASLLEEAGFHPLREQDDWRIEKAEAYYLIRDNGSLICFTLGKSDNLTDGFRLLGAHTDSPTLKIKPRPEKTSSSYFQLGVDLYGSPLLHPWFDRELSIAGRVSCRMSDNKMRNLLIDFNQPMAMIPSLAIHYNKEANKKNPINPQKNLPLLFSQSIEENNVDFDLIILAQVKAQYPAYNPIEILGFDLFCYDCNAPSYYGHNKCFISGPRFDNLLSCFIGMSAMIDSNRMHNTLLVCSNHEEVGSTSLSGASSSFLSSLFERILTDNSQRHRAFSRSFMISMDNGHGLHPNYPDKSDKNHPVLLNHGPVIKINANQRYATNSLSRSIYKMITAESAVPTQDFIMRSDLGCGSTIGPLIAAELGVLSIDIGVPTLGMHSIRETTGADDPFSLYNSIQHFLNRKTNPVDDIS